MVAASADNLRLFCTPVVNLFSSNAEPIETKAGLAYYALKPLSLKTAVTTEVWSVDEVRVTTAKRTAILPPFESLQHALGAAPGLYWTILCDESRRAPKAATEPLKPGQEAPHERTVAVSREVLRGLELALVGTNGQPSIPPRGASSTLPSLARMAMWLACASGSWRYGMGTPLTKLCCWLRRVQAPRRFFVAGSFGSCCLDWFHRRYVSARQCHLEPTE